MKTLLTLLLTAAVAFGQAPQQTNTNGVNIDTDGEANSFLTALARGTSITFDELQRLDGLTSNAQTQLNGKLSLSGGTMTGSIDMGTFNILTGGNVAIDPNNHNLVRFNGGPEIVASWANANFEAGGFAGFGSAAASFPFGLETPTVSATELGYLDGVTSALQTQLNLKAPLASPTIDSPIFTTTATLPAATTIGGTISSTELGHLDGVTSSLQPQIDAKAPLSNPFFTDEVTIKRTGANAILKIETVTSGAPQFFIINGSAGADEKRWDILTGASTQYWRVVNDANSAASTYMQIDRSGITVTGVNFPASLKVAGSDVVSTAGTQTIAGAKTFSGQTELTGQAATNSTSAMTRGLSDTRHGRRYVLRLTSDVSAASTTYVDSGETLSLPAGIYTYSGRVYGLTASTTAGMNINFQPSNTSVDTTAGDFKSYYATGLSGQSLTSSSAGARAGSNLFQFVNGGFIPSPRLACVGDFGGTVVFSSAVTITPRVAQRDATDASNAAVFKIGSYIEFVSIE